MWKFHIKVSKKSSTNHAAFRLGRRRNRIIFFFARLGRRLHFVLPSKKTPVGLACNGRSGYDARVPGGERRVTQLFGCFLALARMAAIRHGEFTLAHN